MNEVEETPRVSRLTLMLWNWQSRIWAVNHWLVIHLFGLTFCHSCSGYFRESCMALYDRCEACYARDYGIHPN